MTTQQTLYAWLASRTTKTYLMLQNWVNDLAISTIISLEMMLSTVTGSAYSNQGSPVEYTGIVLDHDGKTLAETFPLSPCPWCGHLPCDVSDSMDDNELDRYTIHGTFPVECCNPECNISSITDNETWEKRLVPKYVVHQMKEHLSKYNTENDDIFVVPSSYLQQVGMTEDTLRKMGIKFIIFPGDILIKPAIVRTHGYSVPR